ncbi:hypothetical protein [Rhodoferax sp. TH121]|uniref:N-acyl amino acid synthase FeeM domain-containing protein n=1 Tax=Rhodoferax sp. TH121 TaxID=2022803 RepID=UPI00114012D0|nr:hypothetical protein [Rhodoferax sp. TH121]
MVTAARVLSSEGPTEHLPFRVEIASPAQMEGVIQLRAASYGKHLPDLGCKLREAETADTETGCEVFIATSKFDGTVLGTLRTHANVVHAIPLQHSLKLPTRFRGSRMVETTRLCIKGNPNSSLVRSALFKALHTYCLEHNVDWMLATGRRPVDRIYDSLYFSDVGDPGVFYPMTFTGGVPHRVMYLAPQAVQPLWHAARHNLHDFFFATRHPDIDLSRAKPLPQTWYCPEPNADQHTQEDALPMHTPATLQQAPRVAMAC